MLMHWRPHIDWRLYGDILALVMAIGFGIAVAYAFEHDYFHRGPIVIEIDTGLLPEERSGPAINWGGHR